MAMNRGKKGQVGEAIYIIIAIFIIGFVAVMITQFNGAFNDKIQSSDQVQAAGKTVSTTANNSWGNWDKIVFMLWIMTNLAVLASAYFIDVHPLFFVFSVVVWLICAPIMMFVHDSWESYTANSTLSSTASRYPLTNFVFEHLLTNYLLIGALSMIVVYAKSQGGGGN